MAVTEPIEPTLFEQLLPCTFEPQGKKKVPIPVVRVVESVEKRIPQRKRPYRRGWKLDCTSRDGRVWELECVWRADGDEDGEGSYPTDLNAICDAIDVDETGTLYLPTRGAVRAQFKGYRRVEEAEVVDAAVATLTFWEDNEDDATASSFSAPTAKGSARLQAETATELLEQAGTLDDMIMEINEFAAELEAIANFPGDVVDDIDAKANAIATRADQVVRTFSNAHNRLGQDATTLLLEPRNAPAVRSLYKLGDTATRARRDLGVSTKTVVRRFDRMLSIFDVGVLVSQDGSKLLLLNRALPDPLAIPAGTAVRIYA